MNEPERDELLYRIDERTQAIDQKVTKINSRVSENEETIDGLQSKVKRNSTILGGIGTGVTAVLLWVSDKLTRLV